MKILTYTSLFPNATDSNHGIFIQNRMLHYARHYSHELQVVAPVPYFPNIPGFPRWSRYSKIPRQEKQQGITVLHPRYLVTPKAGMMLYGWHMFLGSLASVKRLQRGFDFAVIDAHFLYPDAFAAVLLGQVTRRPVIVSARGTDVHSYTRLLGIRPLLRFVLHRAAAVIAVCQKLKDMIVELGIPQEKVRVIGNGIDLRRFCPGDRLAARRELGLPPDRILILSVARIAEVKGIHHLIDAVTRVRRLRSEVQLILVGSCEDSTYLKGLERRITQAKLDDAVRFVGPQPHAAMRDWYNACDLFCLCSAREGWPNVLLEALACGKPVVASRVGGIPEIVASADYGLLVDPPGGEGFARAIQAALDKHWDVERLVRYATEHSWDQVSAKQENLFQQVVPV